MASLWADAVAHHLKAAIISDSKIVENKPHDELAIGTFAFRREDAHFELSTATLTYDRAASTSIEPVIDWKVESGIVTREGTDWQFEAYGDTAVIEEIMAGQTERAKRHLDERRRLLAQKTTAAFETAVIRVAEAVVLYSQSGDVGGPIDAVGLDQSGVHWINRKPGCRPD